MAVKKDIFNAYVKKQKSVTTVSNQFFSKHKSDKENKGSIIKNSTPKKIDNKQITNR